MVQTMAGISALAVAPHRLIGGGIASAVTAHRQRQHIGVSAMAVAIDAACMKEAKVVDVDSATAESVAVEAAELGCPVEVVAKAAARKALEVTVEAKAVTSHLRTGNHGSGNQCGVYGDRKCGRSGFGDSRVNGGEAGLSGGGGSQNSGKESAGGSRLEGHG